MPSKATLFLIDGSSQMYRAYHAIRGLSGPDGKSTNAVYGFTTMLRKLLTDHQPAYIAASFDLPGPTFRDQMVTDYKANRTAMPGDLAEQIPWVHEACEALGVPVVTSAGFEADDVIATLARCAVQEGYDVAIVTGDKDFFQLVDDRIRVFNPRDEGTWYDAAGVREKWGVGPEQVVDVLALMGDAVDNIKGVPGIGEKGAKDLIATWGTLDALLEHAGEVPQKKYREALLAHADDARQSRELLRFRGDVPCGFDDRRVPIPRLLTRALLCALLTPRVPLAHDGVCPDGGDDREAVRGGDHGRRARRARGGAASRRAVCAAGAARQAHGDARHDRGPRVRHQSSPRVVRAAAAGLTARRRGALRS